MVQFSSEIFDKRVRLLFHPLYVLLLPDVLWMFERSSDDILFPNYLPETSKAKPAPLVACGLHGLFAQLVTCAAFAFAVRVHVQHCFPGVLVCASAVSTSSCKRSIWSNRTVSARCGTSVAKRTTSSSSSTHLLSHACDYFLVLLDGTHVLLVFALRVCIDQFAVGTLQMRHGVGQTTELGAKRVGGILHSSLRPVGHGESVGDVHEEAQEVEVHRNDADAAHEAARREAMDRWLSFHRQTDKSYP
mmetsp:Transcript_11269/g.69628  ORF Transcript_11269/g.69628 Transcript_11269/m.69628 type:complete len:246 (-) Transcript_11269:1537-2274(-)